MLKKIFTRKKEKKESTPVAKDEEFSKFTCVTSEQAKIVVNQCLSLGIKLDSQKLQKLMVLMHGKMLVDFNKAFIDEEIKATPNGIMIPRVDEDFIKFDVKCNKTLVENVSLLQREKKVVDSVLSNYGHMELHELNELLTLKALNLYCLKSNSKTISNELIKKVFSDSNFVFELMNNTKNDRTI